MKRLSIFLMITIFFATAGLANALSLSFVGPSYTLSDEDHDGFSEQLSLGTALVSLADPQSDPILGDTAWETIVFSDLILDPASFAGDAYQFATTSYVDGFALYDDDGTLLLDADLAVESLSLDGSTAAINSEFEINLSNVTLGGGYTQGDSAIVDSFLLGGATNITLQFPGTDLNAQMMNGATVISTYSGSVDPGAVPEPSTVLLLGCGLLAVFGVCRKKMKIQ